MKRALTTLAFLMLAAPASAQDDDPVTTTTQPPETITVTASRAPVPVDLSGSAVTIVLGDTLRERQIDTVFDALRDVPGIEVSRTGTVGSLAQVRIRGAEANHALVLIDGVRVNDPAQSGEEFNFANLLTAAVARVEVLRGPQSALWGSDALAGVINVVTVEPQDGFHARANAEYGSFDSMAASAIVNVGGAGYGAVFDAAWTDTDGNNIARTGHEADGYRNLSVGGRANLDLSDTLRLSAALHHVNSRSDSETTDFFGTFSIPLDSGDFGRFAATYGRAEARWRTRDDAVEIVAGTSLVRTEMKNYTSAFGAPFDVSFNDRTEGGEDRFDAQANFHWDPAQRLSVLAETMHDTFEMRRLDLPGANQDQDETHSGVAAEYGFVRGPVSVSLGARHDWNERFDDSTTWRATVSGGLSDEWRAHASAGTGVKNPDFFEMFGFFPAPAFVGNPNLTPERSFGWDAGIEWSTDGRAVVLDVTYFRADLEDEIFTDFSSFPNTARNANGESTRQGLEFSGHARLTDALTLDAAYTYLDAKESDDAAEIRRPHHIASLNVDWRFAQDRALLNVGVDYHGSQRDTAFLNAPPFSMPVTLGSYTLVRIAGSYDVTDNIALYARIENAFDEHYEEVFGYRTRGFGVFGGIRASFD